MNVNEKVEPCLIELYDKEKVLDAIKNYQCDIPAIDEKKLAENLINIVVNEGASFKCACKLFGLDITRGIRVLNKYLADFDEDIQNRVHTYLLKNRKRSLVEKEQDEAIYFKLTKKVRKEKEDLTAEFCKDRILQFISPSEVIELLCHYYINEYDIKIIKIIFHEDENNIFISYKKDSVRYILRITNNVTDVALIRLFGNIKIGERFISSLNYLLKMNIYLVNKLIKKEPYKLNYKERVNTSFLIYYSYVFIKRFSGNWNYYVTSKETNEVMSQKDKVLTNLLKEFKPELLNSYPFIVRK